jgi:hypothetical protein
MNSVKITGTGRGASGGHPTYALTTKQKKILALLR